MRAAAPVPRTDRFALLALPFVLLATALPAARAADAPPASPAADAASAPRPLTLDEALALGLKNNRDLQAAKVRLRISKADVEKAFSALLPTLSFQGKLTLNEPPVSLSLDQSGTAFLSTYQQAQIKDLNAGAMGANAKGVYDYFCTNSADPAIPGGVKGICATLGPTATQPSSSVLLKTFNAANVTATITPRLQLDGFISANLPLIAPALYPAHKGARLAYASQAKQLEATAIQILTTVASSFYAAAGNDELVSARRHGIEVAQKTLDNAQVRLAAGVVNKVEVTRAALALIQAEQRLLEAKDSQAAAYRTLATAILVEAGSFHVVPAGEASVELASEESLINQALHQRPELLSTQFQVGAYKEQAFSSLLLWSPRLSAFGSIRLTNATGFAGRIDSYAAGLQLDWLIFDGFARDAQRHSWEAQQRDAQLRLEQLRDTISDDVINGRRAALTRKQGLVTADRSVQMAQETLGLVRTQYEAGTATQLDLLNAQDALLQAEVSLAQARFDLSLAILNLRRLSGDTLSVGK